jgi:hypothetical protein
MTNANSTANALEVAIVATEVAAPGFIDPKFFDFTDVSDLPEDLRKRAAAAPVADLVADLAAIVDAAPCVLSLAQIIAVATRMGVTLPADPTVSKHVKTAIELGLIVRVTRQSYGKVGRDTAMVEEVAPVADGTPVVTVADKSDDTDPLGDLV